VFVLVLVVFLLTLVSSNYFCLYKSTGTKQNPGSEHRLWDSFNIAPSKFCYFPDIAGATRFSYKKNNNKKQLRGFIQFQIVFDIQQA